MLIGLITFYVFLGLALVGFAIEAWALVDAVRRPAHSFVTAEKRTKVFWVSLTAVGALIGYLAIPGFSVFGVRIGFGLPWLFTLLAVLPGAIYLADVKPEVIRYLRRPGPSTGRW
ncbi:MULTISPECIES: DUF2516 family protein [Miniimonas]|uniref:DUF2516 family protein n=1 Tax=Miniimonas TaxID=947525 RepID=UPI001F1BD1D8|nr:MULTISPECIES: DUF2516 family protein [Miniimonas]